MTMEEPAAAPPPPQGPAAAEADGAPPEGPVGAEADVVPSGGPTGAEADIAPTTTDAGEPPMTKSRMKKLERAKRLAEKKAFRREREKQLKASRREQRMAEGAEKLSSMTPEELERHREEQRSRRADRRRQDDERKDRLRRGMESGQRIVVDLEFSDKMSQSELRSLCQQLGYVYNANAHAEHPAHLYLTGLSGVMGEAFAKQMRGSENWLATRTEKTYEEFFSEEEKKSLVYLTADADVELSELDPSATYIVGGIVDRNRYKRLCADKAEAQGIRTARLPIGSYIKLASSQVMCTNHVVELLLRYAELGDWKAAFEAVIPNRKRQRGEEEGTAEEGDGTKAASTGDAEEGDGPSEAEGSPSGGAAGEAPAAAEGDDAAADAPPTSS